MERPSSKIMKVIQKSRGKTYRYHRRTTSRKSRIYPDKNRVLNTLKIRKFSERNGFPIGNGKLALLEPFAIVQHYSQIAIGYYNYYALCDNTSILNRLFYILRYSCAKTIARRLNMSMSSVFNKYGKYLKISIQIHTLNSSFNRITSFLILKKLKDSAPQRVERSFDSFNTQQNWRTSLKLFQNCCVCGSSDHVEMHHLNSLKNIKDKNKTSSEYIRQVLNRKQITVCRNCHCDITNGKYHKKKPIKFFNEFIAKL